MRRWLFQVHLWVGVATGLYILAVCLSGAALVFRIDMQKARYPHLFTAAAPAPLADPVQVMESVSRSYPTYRLSGVEAPTSRRPTYLAYVTKGREFLTVLIDPVSTRVLGELPDDPLIESLQRLHFDLMGGRTGRTFNGVGAACILIMCISGIVVWWPGRRQLARGFTIDLSRDWRRIVWELHRAVGIWTVGFLAMFAITGMAFVFNTAFRAAVTAVSPITISRAPLSGQPIAGQPRPTWAQMLERAQQERPGHHIARVVLPFNDRAAFLIMFSDRSPTPAGSVLSSVHLDQYSGAVLTTPESTRTVGDRVMASITPLHVGGYGGTPLRLLWFVMGLAPVLLVISGVTMWWWRVIRPRGSRP
jgi:uncharacterized iron-regulated membrane protein